VEWAANLVLRRGEAQPPEELEQQAGAEKQVQPETVGYFSQIFSQ